MISVLKNKLIILFTIIIIFLFLNNTYASVTTYDRIPNSYETQSFNTDQIYNPLIGGSSNILNTQYSFPVQTEQQNLTSPEEFNIQKKLPIFINGDYVEYRTIEEKVVAKGAAYVKHDKMQLIANNIEADLKKELVFAQGKVIYWQEQKGKLKKVTGEFLVYNIKTGDGFMLDAIVYSDPTITRAKRVELSANKITAPSGVIYTSCDLEKPHWCIKAKEAIIYPNDKMILKKPSYNFFGLTVLKLPYLTMNLKRKEVKKFNVKLGYTKFKGFYQTLSWEYDANEKQFGNLNFENQSKRGTFYNVKHNFKIKDNLSGSFYSDYSYDLLRDETINRNSIIGQYRIGNKSNAILNYNIDYFSDIVSSYTQNKEINYQYNLSYNEQAYDFLVRYKKRRDLSGRPSQYISSLDYTPEINVNTRREQILKTPLFLSTRSILGTREETIAGSTTSRNIFDTQWRLDTERFQLSSQTNLTLDSSYRLRADKTNERENILDGGATLTQNFGKNLNANLRYNNVRSYGYYPFQSNKINTQNQLYSTLTYTSDIVEQGSEVRSNLLQFYYDYDQHQFKNVSNDLTFTYKLNKFMTHRLYLRASYDYQDTSFLDFFSANMNLTNLYIKYDYQNGQKINLQTSTTYDRITRKYQTLNSTIQFEAGPFWTVNTDIIYDLPTKSLRNVNYYIVRDLHCMEALIRANPHQKEYYFEIGIKAFPEDRQRGYYDKTTGRIKRVSATERRFF